MKNGRDCLLSKLTGLTKGEGSYSYGGLARARRSSRLPRAQEQVGRRDHND
jgi:hypothetical protein